MGNEPSADEARRHTGRYAIDEQTGQSYEIVLEDWLGLTMACVSGVYSAVMMPFLLWLLFDTWVGRNLVPGWLGYDPKALATNPTFRLLAFVAIGGALGGTVDVIRGLISWHSEKGAYGPRFIWRDLTLPMVGAAVGLFVYVTVRGGAGVFNGDFSLAPKGGSATISAFALATLAGFSARQVFRWLDAQANRLFNVAKTNDVAIPDLNGMTVEEVKSLFKAWKLQLGAVAEEDDLAHVGKVIKQAPLAGAVVAASTPVDITVGAPPQASGAMHRPRGADPAAVA